MSGGTFTPPSCALRVVVQTASRTAGSTARTCWAATSSARLSRRTRSVTSSGTARGAGRCEQAVLTGLETRLALGRALLRSRFSPHAPYGGSYSADSPHGLPLPGAADTVGRATGIEWRAVPSGSRWVRRAAPGALGRRHGRTRAAPGPKAEDFRPARVNARSTYGCP